MEQYVNQRVPTSALLPLNVMRGTTTLNLSQPQDSASGITFGAVKMDFVKVGLLLFFSGLGEALKITGHNVVFLFFF